MNIPRTFRVCISFSFLTFSLKNRDSSEKEHADRGMAFLSICHVDETLGQPCVILHPRAWRRKTKTLVKPIPARGLFQKKLSVITCFSSKLLFFVVCTLPSRAPANNPFVSERQDFTHPLHNISSVESGKRRNETDQSV